MEDEIPGFEGHPVAATAVKMSGALATEELAGLVIFVDDVVQILSQFRCVGVHHNVNDNTGEITRVQVLRPIEMVLMPVDPNDPDDTGIIRALPAARKGSVES